MTIEDAGLRMQDRESIEAVSVWRTDGQYIRRVAINRARRRRALLVANKTLSAVCCLHASQRLCIEKSCRAQLVTHMRTYVIVRQEL